MGKENERRRSLLYKCLPAIKRNMRMPKLVLNKINLKNYKSIGGMTYVLNENSMSLRFLCDFCNVKMKTRRQAISHMYKHLKLVPNKEELTNKQELVKPRRIEKSSQTEEKEVSLKMIKQEFHCSDCEALSETIFDNVQNTGVKCWTCARTCLRECCFCPSKFAFKEDYYRHLKSHVNAASIPYMAFEKYTYYKKYESSAQCSR